MQDLLALIGGREAVSVTQMQARVRAETGDEPSRRAVRRALDMLVDKGALQCSGSNAGRVLWWRAPGGGDG